MNINGVVNALKPEHLVYDITDSVNAQSTQQLCRQLLKKHPRSKKIYVVCDNARYNRNELLISWAAKQRIAFVYLPTYLPNLDLIERLWHFTRVKILNSTYYEKEVCRVPSGSCHFPTGDQAVQGGTAPPTDAEFSHRGGHFRALIPNLLIAGIHSIR